MIDIIFTASNAWYSRLLRWAEGCTYSHVGIEYDSQDFGGVWLLEAAPEGIVSIPVENSRKGVVRRLRCKYDATKGLKRVGRYVGTSYDYKGAFLLGLFFILQKIWKKIRRPFFITSQQKCSELIIDFILEDQDVAEVKEWDREWVSPQMVMELCLKHSNLFEEIEDGDS